MILLPALLSVMVLGVSPQPVAAQDPTPLDDIEVQAARARTDMARRFVNNITAPSRNRGLGRWKSVCPVVVNLEAGVAGEIANRIAEVASELEIEVQPAGCAGNLVVIFTPEAGAVTRAITASNPEVYRANIGPLTRGRAAFEDFLQTDRPVRWWVVSLPVDPNTGQRAIRLPGDPTGTLVDTDIAQEMGCNPIDCVIGAAPHIARSAGRLNTPIEDRIITTIVVVDIEQVAGLSTAQLADYVSLVSLAQIDMAADTGGFDTVLNLFEDPQGVIGLTAWDEAYLRALYGSRSARRSQGSQATAVASLMNRIATAED